MPIILIFLSTYRKKIIWIGVVCLFNLLYVLFHSSISNAELDKKILDKSLRTSYYAKKIKSHYSKTILDDNEPEIFNTTNNLVTSHDKMSTNNTGTMLFIGKVVDGNNIPIGDTKVYMWQADRNNKFPYTPLKDSANPALFQNQKNIYFVGSGIATSDNNGVFKFIALHPKNRPVSMKMRNIEIDDELIRTQIKESDCTFYGNECHFCIVVPNMIKKKRF